MDGSRLKSLGTADKNSTSQIKSQVNVVKSYIPDKVPKFQVKVFGSQVPETVPIQQRPKSCSNSRPKS